MLVGEDDKGVGIDEVGDEGGEGVVVAEFDFVGGDGVVFVDDGDDAFVQQGFEGAAGVEVAGAAAEVFVGEEDLRGVDAVRAEGGFVGLGESHLADGCCCLQFVEGGGAARPAEAFDAFGDGAAGNEDDADAALFEGGDLRCPTVEGVLVDAAPFGGDEAGADFDDDQAGLGDVGVFHVFSFVCIFQTA